MGARCTHYQKSSIDLAFLAERAKESGVPENSVRQIEHAHTTRHAIQFILEEYQHPLFSRIAEMIEAQVKDIANTYLKTEILILTYDGRVMYHEG